MLQLPTEIEAGEQEIGMRLHQLYMYKTGGTSTRRMINKEAIEAALKKAEKKLKQLKKEEKGMFEEGLVKVVTSPADNPLDNVTDLGMPKTGMKFDTGKPMFSLLEETFAKELLDIAQALTYGAKKYSPDNWKKVELVRYKDALGRHLNSWRQGEKCDPESGMQHLTHAMVNMLFIQWLENNVKDVK